MDEPIDVRNLANERYPVDSFRQLPPLAKFGGQFAFAILAAIIAFAFILLVRQYPDFAPPSPPSPPPETTGAAYASTAYGEQAKTYDDLVETYLKLVAAQQQRDTAAFRDTVSNTLFPILVAVLGYLLGRDRSMRSAQ